MTLISQDQGKYVATDGEFIRDTTYISDRIVASAHPESQPLSWTARSTGLSNRTDIA